MFDIVTLEPDDPVVMLAVNAIIRGEEGMLPKPGGNYRLFAGSTGVKKTGTGGADQHVVAVVGHGDVNHLSGHETFASYIGDCNGDIDWKTAKSVFLVACSTKADDGAAFLHGSIASEAATRLRGTTVWASPKAVTATTLSGEWDKVAPSVASGHEHDHRR